MTKEKKRLSRNRKLCFLMALVVLICGAFLTPTTAQAESVKDLQDKLEQLERDSAKYKKELEGMEDDIEKQGQYRDKIDQKILANQELITQLEVEIDGLKSDIKKLEDEIEKEYNASKERVRAMYMMDDDSVLYALFQSSSFSDYLDRLDSVNRVHKKDQEVIKNLVNKQKKLEDKKKELEQSRLTLKNKEAKLAEEKAEYTSVIQSIEAAMFGVQEKREANAAAEEATHRKLEEALEKDGSESGSYTGGDYLWPVSRSRGNCYISSPFGWRWIDGRQHYHTGVDISASGISGTPIVASRSGTVILVDYSASGYGHHAVISHGKDNNGNSYSTLYAHATQIIVSEGQRVSKGQTIGYVGTTGWSTGPHLHFEVQKNNVPQNPLSYL